MDKLVILIIVSIICESVWETLKMTWQEGKVSIDRVGALIIGILIAFITQTDILILLDIKTTIPIVGVALTGILISRGSNFIHDLLSQLAK